MFIKFELFFIKKPLSSGSKLALENKNSHEKNPSLGHFIRLHRQSINVKLGMIVTDSTEGYLLTQSKSISIKGVSFEGIFISTWILTKL